MERTKLPNNAEHRALMAQAERCANWARRVESARLNWQELQKIADEARDFYLLASERYEKEVHALSTYHTNYDRSLVEGRTNG